MSGRFRPVDDTKKRTVKGIRSNTNTLSHRHRERQLQAMNHRSFLGNPENRVWKAGGRQPLRVTRREQIQ